MSLAGKVTLRHAKMFVVITVFGLGPFFGNGCGPSFKAQTLESSLNLKSENFLNVEVQKVNLLVKGYCDPASSAQQLTDLIVHNHSVVFEENELRRASALDGMSDYKKALRGFDPLLKSTAQNGYSDFIVNLFGMSPINASNFGMLKGFDGKPDTFFEAWSNQGEVYLGRDLGSPKTIDRIRVLPRIGYQNRMLGGQFRASNNSSLSESVLLATVTSVNADGSWQEFTLSNPAVGYRYVYFTNQNVVSIAEVEFYGY